MHMSAEEEKMKRDRSPSYPMIPLGHAINRLAAFDEYFKRHPAPFKQIGLAWSIKPGSSQATGTAAALKSFGLVEYQGAGDDLKVLLSNDGRTYLRAQQESTKKEVLQRVALNPKAIAKYWAEWGSSRPPDPVCLDELVLKAKFSPSGADAFLKVYDSTISYAGLVESSKLADRLLDELARFPPKLKVGDFVQWENNGVLQFPQPRRVMEVTESGDFAMVDGSTTGLPIKELTVVSPPPPADTKIEPSTGMIGLNSVAPKAAASAGMRQDVWNLDEGAVVLQYPAKMSAASFQDFEDWINLQLNRIKRGINQQARDNVG
jgi:hypothetical protein